MKQDFSSVQGKVAIVTGASRGIGRAIAQVYGVNGIRSSVRRAAPTRDRL